MTKLSNKIKILKISIITLIIVLFCLTFGITASVLAHNNFDDKISSTAASIDFDNCSSTGLMASDSTYTNNTYFSISSNTGLDIFAKSVANGCDFTGKIVSLTSNVYYDKQTFNGIGMPTKSTAQYYVNNGANASISPFCGTFDGDGYKINAIRMKMGYRFITKSIVGVSDSYGSPYGLFGALGNKAVVKNLKIEDFRINVDDYKYWYDKNFVTIGAIAGVMYANVSIINCEVDNFTVVDSVYESYHSNHNQRDEFVGGIVGEVYASSVANQNCSAIQHCLVSSFQSKLYPDSYFSGWNGVGAFVAYMSERYNITLANCVLNNTDSYPARDGNHEFYAYVGINEDGATIQGCYKSKNYGYSSLQKCSSVGGEDLSYWYYARDYADFPLLRSFMKYWNDVIFNISPEGIDGDAPDSITIPFDARKEYNSAGEVINIYDQIVRAPQIAGYTFLWWTCNSWLEYTAVYMENIYILTFETVNVNGVEIRPNIAEVEIRLSDSITTKVNRTNNSYTYVISQKYGDPVEVVYSLDQVLSYEINTWGDISPVNADRTIVPTFKLKSYNVELE